LGYDAKKRECDGLGRGAVRSSLYSARYESGFRQLTVFLKWSGNDTDLYTSWQSITAPSATPAGWDQLANQAASICSYAWIVLSRMTAHSLNKIAGILETELETGLGRFKREIWKASDQPLRIIPLGCNLLSRYDSDLFVRDSKPRSHCANPLRFGVWRGV
jgi:hypothetical protein